jgi:hypothetical protein
MDPSLLYLLSNQPHGNDDGRPVWTGERSYADSDEHCEHAKLYARNRESCKFRENATPSLLHLKANLDSQNRPDAEVSR